MQFKRVQDEIGKWAEETFDHTEQGIAIHLLSEAVELCLAVGIGYGAISNAAYDAYHNKQGKEVEVAEEDADVAILALTLANFDGFNLEQEIDTKMAENKSRDWSARSNPARFLPQSNGQYQEAPKAASS